MVHTDTSIRTPTPPPQISDDPPETGLPDKDPPKKAARKGKTPADTPVEFVAPHLAGCPADPDRQEVVEQDGPKGSAYETVRCRECGGQRTRKIRGETRNDGTDDE